MVEEMFLFPTCFIRSLQALSSNSHGDENRRVAHCTIITVSNTHSDLCSTTMGYYSYVVFSFHFAHPPQLHSQKYPSTQFFNNNHSNLKPHLATIPESYVHTGPQQPPRTNIIKLIHPIIHRRRMRITHMHLNKHSTNLLWRQDSRLPKRNNLRVVAWTRLTLPPSTMHWEAQG